MYLSRLPNQAIISTVYERLKRLYEFNASRQEDLKRLPEEFRNKIFHNIWEQAGGPDEADYGKLHVFECPIRLKEAVKNVAVAAFRSINRTDMDKISWKIWDRFGRPNSGDNRWGENHAADDILLLLKIMHTSLGDLTHEFEKILDEWVLQAETGEDRSKAKNRIINFLKDPRKTALALDGLGLKSLPDIFDKEPWISRLTELTLTGNQLRTIPDQICQLKNLNHLNISGNQLRTIPDQICQLQQLRLLSLSNNPTLQSLPGDALFHLHNDCRVYLQRTELLENVRRNLQQTCTSSDYQGPTIFYLEPSPWAAISSTPYQHLYNLYEPNDPAVQEESLNALPERFREQIFHRIWELAGSPDEADYGKLHVFNSSPKLQQAVKDVAVDALQSINPTKRNEITEKVQDYYNRQHPSEGSSREAADNIPLLLKTMDDSLGDLTPELQEALDAWGAAGMPRENRDGAVLEIIRFLQNPRKKDINLSNYNLRSFPGFFDQPPFISRLLTIDCTNNLIQSLPEEIGNLTHLNELILANNYLEEIPSTIGNLTHLNKLNLANNWLKQIPSKIGDLTDLTELILANNDLKEIPSTTGRLTHLKELILTNNRLRSLPQEIGNLESLRKLELSDNFRLSSLPISLLNLNQACDVHLENTEISPWNIFGPRTRHLRSTAPRPNFLYTTTDIQQRNIWQDDINQIKPLSELMAELFSKSGEAPKSFPELHNLNTEATNSLRSWLNRLQYTSEYQQTAPKYPGAAREYQDLALENQDRTESSKMLAKRIVNFLQVANDNSEFREIFLQIIKDASDRCGDKAALSILYLGIALRSHQLRLEQIEGPAEPEIKHITKLKNFLIKTVWPIEMLAKCAREKIDLLVSTYHHAPNQIEAIEIYLSFPILLQKKLQLDIAIKEMRFFGCSRLTTTDLNKAAEYVENQRADPNAACTFLSEQTAWTEALRAEYPQEWQHMMEENFEDLEKTDKNPDELDLKARAEERLVALTAWALANIDE